MPDNFFSTIRHWLEVDPNPVALHAGQDHPRDVSDGIRVDDIEHALHTVDTPVDVIEGELQLIFQLAKQHAARRRIIPEQRRQGEQNSGTDR